MFLKGIIYTIAFLSLPSLSYNGRIPTKGMMKRKEL
jgi:hypothetical protein